MSPSKSNPDTFFKPVQLSFEARKRDGLLSMSEWLQVKREEGDGCIVLSPMESAVLISTIQRQEFKNAEKG